MDKKLNILQYSAIFKDFDKILNRAGLYKDETNSEKSYLEENKLIPNEYKDIYSYIGTRELSDIKEDSLYFVLNESSHIVEGTEKINIGENETFPLHSIFNEIYKSKNQKDKYFNFSSENMQSYNIPSAEYKNLNKGNYTEVLESLKTNLKSISDVFTVEKVLNLFSQTTSFIPYDSRENYHTISYYDHIKLTTALASSMYLYDKENGIFNYSKEYVDELDKSRQKPKFLFVSGEFSGIQNFIYTITSKRAMKSLRGRSFYLELFTEHIIDEILKEVGLSRANLLYSGGSQFYMILPNVEDSIEVLVSYKDTVNDFLLETIGTNLYFELVYSDVTAYELANNFDKDTDKNLINDVFKRLSIKSSHGKSNRYNASQLGLIFDEDSDFNKIKSYTSECSICKKSVYEKGSDETVICDSCKNYIELGADIARLYFYKDEFFAEFKDYDDSGLGLPTYDGNTIQVKRLTKSQLTEKIKSGNIYRYYAINQYYVGNELCKNILIGNYNQESEKGYNLIEFEDLAKRSKGINRLAVFRADVDNLGMLFQRGFNVASGSELKNKVTLAKTAVLSRYVSDFFKRKINLILEKSDDIDIKNTVFKEYCNLITKNEDKKPRDVVIVYSGGDDVFAIGAWNDVIEFSIDLYNAFKEFTNEKITLSAGIGFFTPSYPVYQMAKQTGELEDISKKYSINGTDITKDAVTLFGTGDENINHIYSWDEFIKNVLEEKYAFINNVITFNSGESSDRVFVSKSAIYRLMNLLRRRLLNNDRLDIARYAYILGRIRSNNKNADNYNKLKKTLLMWMKNPDDAKELLTAIYLKIYSERED